MSAGTSLAQFDSGSDGSDGALSVATDTTLDLPADGIFRFTTITVASNATLRLNCNALNTPVYLLATSNVVINGTIDVSGSTNNGVYGGKGGPGGFDGGNAMIGSLNAGYGHGPGGSGVNGGGPANYGNVILSPIIGGSGGGGSGVSGGNGGGGGGGAILIASSTQVTLNGTVRSYGGTGATWGGSGAIRLVAPVVNGSGSVNSGNSGRARIDTYDRVSWALLRFVGVSVTGGSQMFVFPPGNPKLDIISAAGTSIPPGTNAAVIVSLPVGSPTTQLVRVQATGFTNDVPIRVQVAPENGNPATYDTVILQSSGNPPFVDVDVTLRYDTPCHIHAWTR